MMAGLAQDGTGLAAHTGCEGPMGRSRMRAREAGEGEAPFQGGLEAVASWAAG